MALDPVVNFFRSTIATLPVASGGTSIVITTGDGAKLPDPAVDGNFNLTIYNEDDPFDAPEIVRVTAIAGDTLTVTRAQEGTSATNKTAGNTWYLELTPTAKTIQDIDTAKLDVADVVDNLTSTDTDKALSANQGKVLQDGKLNLSGGTMTGDLTIPDKIIHSGDTNTAIRFPADDTVTVETAGVERMRVDSSGNVGFGVIPDTTVHIGRTNGTATLRISRDRTNSSITTQPFGNIQGSIKSTLYESGEDIVGYLIRGIAEGAFNDGVSYPTAISFENISSGETTLSEKVIISNNGNVGIGTTTPATKLDVNGSIRTSTGILFGADTAAANTLDDYEEGTWTPTYEPASGAFDAITYNTQSGFYTKIGNMVSLRFFLRITSLTKGAASGGARVGNLPFAAANTRATAAVWSTSFLVNHPSVCQVALSEIVLYYRDDADGSSNNTLDVTDLGTGANANSIIVSLTYQAS
jgi:hypothetical protein